MSFKKALELIKQGSQENLTEAVSILKEALDTHHQRWWTWYYAAEDTRGPEPFLGQGEMIGAFNTAIGLINANYTNPDISKQFNFFLTNGYFFALIDQNPAILVHAVQKGCLSLSKGYFERYMKHPNHLYTPPVLKEEQALQEKNLRKAIRYAIENQHIPFLRSVFDFPREHPEKRPFHPTDFFYDEAPSENGYRCTYLDKAIEVIAAGTARPEYSVEEEKKIKSLDIQGFSTVEDALVFIESDDLNKNFLSRCDACIRDTLSTDMFLTSWWVWIEVILRRTTGLNFLWSEVVENQQRKEDLSQKHPQIKTKIEELEKENKPYKDAGSTYRRPLKELRTYKNSTATTPASAFTEFKNENISLSSSVTSTSTTSTTSAVTSSSSVTTNRVADQPSSSVSVETSPKSLKQLAELISGGHYDEAEVILRNLTETHSSEWITWNLERRNSSAPKKEPILGEEEAEYVIDAVDELITANQKDPKVGKQFVFLLMNHHCVSLINQKRPETFIHAVQKGCSIFYKAYFESYANDFKYGCSNLEARNKKGKNLHVAILYAIENQHIPFLHHLFNYRYARGSEQFPVFNPTVPFNDEKSSNDSYQHTYLDEAMEVMADEAMKMAAGTPLTHHQYSAEEEIENNQLQTSGKAKTVVDGLLVQHPESIFTNYSSRIDAFINGKLKPDDFLKSSSLWADRIFKMPEGDNVMRNELKKIVDNKEKIAASYPKMDKHKFKEAIEVLENQLAPRNKSDDDTNEIDLSNPQPVARRSNFAEIDYDSHQHNSNNSGNFATFCVVLLILVTLGSFITGGIFFHAMMGVEWWVGGLIGAAVGTVLSCVEGCCIGCGRKEDYFLKAAHPKPDANRLLIPEEEESLLANTEASEQPTSEPHQAKQFQLRT